VNSLSSNQPPTRQQPSTARRISALLDRYGDILWWLHSLWGLIVGVAVMWVGSRHYGLLRLAVFQIAFIWIASLAAPALVRRAADSKWVHRLRLVLNYFSRNFYQQLAYFLLPLYFASASRSWNLFFVALVAVSAVLSTIDIFYDRHLSVRRGLLATFFAFNLFACINAMLPVVWSISNARAMRVSAGLALVAFTTVLFGRRGVAWRKAAAITLVSAAVLFALVEFARPLIPPAPLRVMSATFGPDVNRREMRVSNPIDRVDPAFSGRLYVLTTIYAPMGLEDRVAHRWYENGRLVCSSPFYRLVGGRKEGFRLWTSCALRAVRAGRLTVDVKTEGGQLIGRAGVPVEKAAGLIGDTKLPAPF
jgi:hypothetical protein